jgi:hypothetical protein
MGRRVQDQVRRIADEDVAQAIRIDDIGDDRGDQGAGAGGDEFLLGLIKQHLALIEHDEAGRRTRGDLAAKLRADAAAGAGDEHDAPFHHRIDGVVVELGGLAAQDVLDGDGADVARADAAAGEFRHGRDDQDAEVAGRGERAHLADAPHGRSG